MSDKTETEEQFDRLFGDFEKEMNETSAIEIKTAETKEDVSKTSPYPSNTPTKIEAILEERGQTHGDFIDHAACAQDLKKVFRHHHQRRLKRGQNPLTNMQMEAIEMNFHKLGRIVAGQSEFQDHWDDIAGYAKIANGANLK